MQRAPKSTRVFVGKLGTLTKQDLFKECSAHGNIVDFLMKEQYAFVVPAQLSKILGIRYNCRSREGNHRSRWKILIRN